MEIILRGGPYDGDDMVVNDDETYLNLPLPGSNGGAIMYIKTDELQAGRVVFRVNNNGDDND